MNITQLLSFLCVESSVFTAVIYQFVFRHQPVLQGVVLFADVQILVVCQCVIK